MLKEFRTFVLRGNLIDLAVAFVMGVAFTALVSGFVEGLITPLIALVAGEPDFKGMKFIVSGTTFPLGLFVEAAFTLVITALVLFFGVVKPLNALEGRLLTDQEEPLSPNLRSCPECLSEIAVAARRCAFCTSMVEPVTG